MIFHSTSPSVSNAYGPAAARVYYDFDRLQDRGGGGGRHRYLRSIKPIRHANEFSSAVRRRRVVLINSLMRTGPRQETKRRLGRGGGRVTSKNRVGRAVGVCVCVCVNVQKLGSPRSRSDDGKRALTTVNSNDNDIFGPTGPWSALMVLHESHARTHVMKCPKPLTRDVRRAAYAYS